MNTARSLVALLLLPAVAAVGWGARPPLPAWAGGGGHAPNRRIPTYVGTDSEPVPPMPCRLVGDSLGRGMLLAAAMPVPMSKWGVGTVGDPVG